MGLECCGKKHDFKAGLYLQKKVRKYFYSDHDNFSCRPFKIEFFEIKRKVYDFMNSQVCTVTSNMEGQLRSRGVIQCQIFSFDMNSLE